MTASEATVLNQNSSQHTLEATPLAWLVVMTASLFFFWEFMQLNMFNTLNPYLMRDFNITATQLGYFSGTFTIAEVIFLFPAGVMLDHFSTKKLILTAMSFGIGGTIAFAFAHNFWFACFTHLIAGFGAAFCFLACMKLATRWFPPRRLALVTGMIVTVAMVGGVVSQTPMELLILKYGWRQAVMIDASVGILIFALIAWIIKDCSPNELAHEAESQHQLEQLGFWPSIRLALSNKQNWLCGIYTSLLNLPLAVLGALWGQLYLSQMHHINFVQASVPTSMLFFGTIFGSPILGAISDKVGRRKAPMIFCAVISLALVWLIMNMQHPSLMTLNILFFILGFITSSQVIGYPTIAESNPHHLTGTSVGVASVLIIGSYPIFQTLFGWLMDKNWNGTIVNGIRMYSPENYHLAMLVIPAGFVIGLIAALFIKETYCETLVENPNA